MRQIRGRSDEDWRKAIEKGKLLVHRGCGDVGITGGVAFRDDAVGEPTLGLWA